MTGPNPARIGACPECGTYRSDGRPPYLHRPGCELGGDLQLGRWLAELTATAHGGPVTPPDLICPACGQPVTRQDHMSRWACGCRTWVTDEQLAQAAAGPVLHVDFWHGDGTVCGHGWPPGAEPPVAADGDHLRTALPGQPLTCAGDFPIAWYRITVQTPPGQLAQPEELTLDRPPPGWTFLGTSDDGGVLYTAPPGTPLRKAEQ